MSRFGTYCKRCRCFRENITSPEVKIKMLEHEQLCFAGEDPYQGGVCRFYLDLEEPIENIVRKSLERESPSSETLHGNTTGA